MSEVPSRRIESRRVLYSAGKLSRPAMSRMRNGSAPTRTTRARSSSPLWVRTPTAVPFSTRICLTPLLVSMTAPAAAPRRRTSARRCPCRPRPTSPRAAGAGQAAHVVDQEVHAGPGRVPGAVDAGEAVGRGVHRPDQVALEQEAVDVLADRLAAQVDEHLPQRAADVALGGVLERQRLVEPRRRQVVAQLGQLGLHGLVGVPVGLRREGGVLALGLFGVGAEQQVAAVGGGQEVVRVAPPQREVDAGDLQQLGLHRGRAGRRRSRSPGRGARNGFSVRTAPPTTSFSSSTRTRRPRLASNSAATRPLWPAPTTITSVSVFMGRTPYSMLAAGATFGAGRGPTLRH